MTGTQHPRTLLFTSPIAVSSLDPSDRQCPICLEDYIEHPTTQTTTATAATAEKDEAAEKSTTPLDSSLSTRSTPNPPRSPVLQNPEPRQTSTSEWPVRVDLSANQTSSTRLCGHIFGQKCLTALTRKKSFWKERCPICRMRWYEASVGGDRKDGLMRHWLGRNLGREVRDEAVRDGDAGAGGGDGGKDVEVPGFIRHVFDAFEMEEGCAEVRGTVDDVEKVLGEFYAQRGGVDVG